MLFLTDPHWITTIGLLMDIAGAALLSVGLFTNEEKALQLGLPYWASEKRENNLKAAQVQDRLRQSHYAMIGLPLLVGGFVLQLIATWMH